MRKKGKVGVLFLGFVLICQLFMLVGCGEKSSEMQSTGVSVDKDGRITSTIVESFDKDYYTVDGLKAQIEEEISSYENASAISLKTAEEIQIDKEGSQSKGVRVVMEFATGKDYQNFNGKICFFGTVEEARNSGYAFDGQFANPKGEQKELGLTDLVELGDCKVLIVEENMQIAVYGKVQYLSATAKLVDNSIETQSEELTYVIIK